jgi:hypothetical protein
MQRGRGYLIRRNRTDKKSAMRDVGDTQNEEADRVSEAIVLVGDIPCLIMGSIHGKERYGEDNNGQETRGRSPNGGGINPTGIISMTTYPRGRNPCPVKVSGARRRGRGQHRGDASTEARQEGARNPLVPSGVDQHAMEEAAKAA